MGQHLPGPAAATKGRLAARRLRDLALAACVAASVPPCGAQPLPPRLAEGIQHVIVLYTENRSFDSVYGSFPGANGLSSAKADQYRQTDREGRILDFLPQPYLSDETEPDPRLPPAADRDRFGHGISDLSAEAPNGRFLANRYYD